MKCRIIFVGVLLAVTEGAFIGLKIRQSIISLSRQGTVLQILQVVARRVRV